ncbi:hypothetical protein DO62_2762 [Burkholderia pseudomallei]|nr:hypothetical protein DO62_2762 [Burkholderia pseudomallei]
MRIRIVSFDIKCRNYIGCFLKNLLHCFIGVPLNALHGKVGSRKIQQIAKGRRWFRVCLGEWSRDAPR